MLAPRRAQCNTSSGSLLRVITALVCEPNISSPKCAAAHFTGEQQLAEGAAAVRGHDDEVAAHLVGGAHDGVVDGVGALEAALEGHALLVGLVAELVEHLARVGLGEGLEALGFAQVAAGVAAQVRQRRVGLGHEAGDARAELGRQRQAGLLGVFRELGAIDGNEQVLVHGVSSLAAPGHAPGFGATTVGSAPRAPLDGRQRRSSPASSSSFTNSSVEAGSPRRASRPAPTYRRVPALRRQA